MQIHRSEGRIGISAEELVIAPDNGHILRQGKPHFFQLLHYAEGNQIADGTMMPMNASDGQHYGNNIALPEGEGYSVKLSIKNPGENGMLLHTDETGPEADAWWDEPIEATWTGWDFVKQW